MRSVLASASALACFTAEAAGLAFSGHGPALLAVDVATPLVVMADLGSAPSLSDVLLGGSAAAARSGLVAWASGYGRIAAASIGRQGELLELRERYYRGRPSGDGADWINDRIAALPDVLDALRVAAPVGLGADLAAVAARPVGACFDCRWMWPMRSKPLIGPRLLPGPVRQ